MKKSLGTKTLIYPLPAWVVCAYDQTGKATGMTAAWGGICCSEPPCVAVSVRKARHTFDALIARKAFTVNVGSEKHARETDYFGVASGAKVDKFARVGLTAVKSELVEAPYISEFPLILECRLLHTLDLGSHTQFIGEILDVKCDEDCLSAKGQPDIEKLRPIIYATGTRGYFGVGKFLGEAYKMAGYYGKGA